MFNLITHKINNERSDYLYTHFLLETNGSAPISTYLCVFCKLWWNLKKNEEKIF